MSSLLERLGRWNLRRLGARDLTVDVGGASIQVYEIPGRGTGEIALLHGVGASPTTFGPLLRRLRRHFARLVLPEAPGHGRSQVPDGPLTPELLFNMTGLALDRTMRDERFCLYGNSLGGGAALRYAITRPGRVSHLMLLSPAGAQSEPGDLERLVAGFDLQTRAQARAFMRRLFHRRRWYTRFAAPDLRRRLRAPAVRALLSAARPSDQLDGAELRGLTMPILLLWGGSERVLPAAHLTWFKAHLPTTAEILEPSHFGHSAYIEYPADVAQAITGFVQPTAA